MQENPTGRVVGPIELTAVAHGGWSVGRFDGRVVFVSGGIPDERVMVRITDASKKRFWRGEVAEVLLASPLRVEPPCQIARRCGGCDFQHVSYEAQRELKRQVVAEQLSRLADIEWSGEVRDVGEHIGWRTRMRYARAADGSLGLRSARSHEVVPLPKEGCLIAHPAGRNRLHGALGDEVVVTVASSGIALNGTPPVVSELVNERSFDVSSTGFWQVHPRAATILVDAAIGGLVPRAGEVALDLYCGSGLFSGFLADSGAVVVGIEGNARAVELARVNVPRATFHHGDVATMLRKLKPRADIVVLDPPRSGAGRSVVTGICAVAPRAIAYVACDPAALARDLATFGERGYEATEIRAYDLFPMTHHVECVALLAPRRRN